MTDTPIKLYVLHLNPAATGMTDRYSVMRMTDDGSLSPLWGIPDEGKVCTDNPRKAAKAWPYMVYVNRPAHGHDRYPAFHFAIRGYGFSKLQEMAESLAHALAWPVELYSVTGWHSSITRAAPRKRGTRKAALARLAMN
jgi:hypothetical protein